MTVARRKISPKMERHPSLAFITAETAGVVVSTLARSHGIDSVLSYSLSQVGTIAIRTIFLVILSAISLLGLKEAIYTPAPKRIRSGFVILIAIGLVFASNVLIGIQSTGSYSAQSLGAFYFLNKGGPALLLGLPIQAVYYFSEVIVTYYMYVLARRGWNWHAGPITSGTIFLILGWASLYTITKAVFVAIDGIALVLIFYVAYKYAERSPLAPIVLWFAQLLS